MSEPVKKIIQLSETQPPKIVSTDLEGWVKERGHHALTAETKEKLSGTKATVIGDAIAHGSGEGVEIEEPTPIASPTQNNIVSFVQKVFGRIGEREFRNQYVMRRDRKEKLKDAA